MIAQGKEINPPSNAKQLSDGGSVELTLAEQTEQSIYIHKIGSKTVTKPEGTRVLVNEGTAGGEYILQSGQGLRFDGSQYVDISNWLSSANGATITATVRWDGGLLESAAPFVSAGHATLFGHGGIGGNVGCRINATWYDSGIAMATAKQATFVIDASNTTVTTYVNGVFASVHDLLSGGVNSTFNRIGVKQDLNSQSWVGVISSLYGIPHAMTAAEVVKHFQLPENTIYIKNGAVRSAFLPQAVLGAMSAGNGFAYPLCENNGAGNLVHDISKPAAVSKGDFSGDYSDFTLSPEATIVNGEAVLSNSTYSNIRWNKPLEQGVIYVVEIDVLSIGGSELRENGTWSTIATKVGINRALLTGDGSSLVIYQNIYNGTAIATVIKSIKITALSQSNLSRIVNYENSEMRATADFLDVGLQTALLELDDIGQVVGLAKAGELNWSGEATATATAPVTVKGDFTLDIMVDKASDFDGLYRRYVRLDLKDSLSNVIGSTQVQSDNDSKTGFVYIGPGGGYKSFTKKSILSIEVVGSSIYAYINNNLVSSRLDALTLYSYAELAGQRFGFSVHATTGSLMIANTSRTDAERAVQIGELITKHGVII